MTARDQHELEADDTSRPMRQPYKADRTKALHPDARGEVWHGMTGAKPALLLGTGDRKPPVLRPGALDAAALPSLMGGRLVYPAQPTINATTTKKGTP